jgi:hypothetical protein
VIKSLALNFPERFEKRLEHLEAELTQLAGERLEVTANENIFSALMN